MKLVLMDIDGTLLRGPSAERRFARYLIEQRRIGLREALQFARFTLRYLPNFGSGVLRKNKAYVAGMCIKEVRELADAFVTSSLTNAFFEPACARVREHLQHGDDVWLLSGTLGFIAESVARLMHVENLIATDCALDKGAILARPPVQHPYGRTKLQIARQLSRDRKMRLDEAVAYADSWADRHLLEQVGTPVVVMPDKKLAALALTRGWEIIGDQKSLATDEQQTSTG